MTWHPCCASQQYCANQMSLMNVGAAFTKSGTFLLKALLLGTLQYYRLTNVEGSPSYDGPHTLTAVDAFHQSGMREFGLTGITLSHNFDERDGLPDFVFLSVQGLFDDTSEYKARIYKVPVTESNGVLTAGASTIIYERVGPEIAANAHNLHGGMTTTLPGGQEALVISFGDLNDYRYGSNPNVDYAKILLMDYDGNAFNKTIFDTGWPNNMHLAYNNRNMLMMRRLASNVDPNERVMWGENGNSYQRAALYSLMTPGQAHDLKWNDGTDNQDWLRMNDPVTGANAVLYSDVDTAGVWVEPFASTEAAYAACSIPIGTHYALHSYMSPEPGTGARIRTLNLEYMANLMGAPQPAGYLVIETLARATTSATSAPMAVTIHPPSGDVVFFDVFNGNGFHLHFKDLASLIENPQVQATGCTADPQWFVHVPNWAWIVTGFLILFSIGGLGGTATFAFLYFYKTRTGGLLTSTTPTSTERPAVYLSLTRDYE